MKKIIINKYNNMLIKLIELINNYQKLKLKIKKKLKIYKNNYLKVKAKFNNYKQKIKYFIFKKTLNNLNDFLKD